MFVFYLGLPHMTLLCMYICMYCHFQDSLLYLFCIIVTYSHWTMFVEQQIKRWNAHFDWLLKCPLDRDIILVRYEDLQSNVVLQVERILRFLRIPYRRELVHVCIMY